MNSMNESKVPKLEYLGKIVTTSPFVASLYGDQRLFFKHTPFAADLRCSCADGWRDAVGSSHFLANEGALAETHPYL